MKKRLISMALAASMAIHVVPVPVLAVNIGGGGGQFSSNSDPVSMQSDPGENEVGYSFFVWDSLSNQKIPYTVTKPAEGSTPGEVEVSFDDQSSPNFSGDVKILGTVTSNENNYTVTSIADRAFYYCTYLTSIELPISVTSIGSSAFVGTGLRSISFDASENDRGKELPLSIGNFAFASCKSLNNADILKYATSIGQSAFQGCTGLKTALIHGSVGKSAFSDCVELTNVRLYYGVESIGEYAFSGCNKISSITIPSSVTSIGASAFRGCNLSQGFTVDGNSPFSVENGVLYEKTTDGKRKLYSYPSSYNGSFKIPDDVISIGDHAFYGSSLNSVMIPDSVTSIGMYAFESCSNLTNVTIPNRVTSIAHRAFYECSNLTSVVIPDSVTSIEQEAFRFCSKLTSVTIPGSVTKIGWGAFNGCNNLNTIYYTGTSDQWSGLNLDNDINAKVKYVRTLTLSKPDDVVVKLDGTAVNDTAEVGLTASELTDGKPVTLTVENPETEKYTYKWAVTGAEYTVSADSASCEIKFTQDTTVTLTRIQKLTVGDLIITFPDGEYDGTEKEVIVTDKSGNDIPCEITYTKEGETGGSTAAPKDAGTYKVTITIKDGEHNGEIIEAGSFTIREKPAPKPDEKPEPAATYDLTVKGGTVKVNGKDAAADGVVAVEKGAAVEVSFDKSTLSDAQVFDMWSIAPESVLNAVDPKAETLRFAMPAEKVALEAMTRDASIADDGPGVLGTVAMVGVAGAGAAVLGYTGYMIGTELYLNTVLPAGTAIPQNYGELAKLLWTAAGMPAPAAVLAADAADEQKALAWAAENQLLPADKAADDSVTRWEVIRSWNEMKG